MIKKTISKAHARKLAKYILQQNRNGRSFRVMVQEDFPGMKPGTLNRFAKAEGEWIPKDDHILTILGLKKDRSPFAGLPKWFQRTDEALQFYKSKKEEVKQMSQDTREAMKRRNNNGS